MTKAIAAGAASVVLAAAVAAAGWWLLVRDTAQLATSAPEIPAALINTTATPEAEATEAPTATEVSTDSILTFEVNSETFRGGVLRQQRAGDSRNTVDGERSDESGQRHPLPDRRRLAGSGRLTIHGGPDRPHKR